MLKEILSVSGKPGLFKLISQGKNMFVAESLLDHKRIPVYMRDKVISLGDISIYTDAEEVPLGEVLTKIKEKENGQQVEYSASITPEELKAYFETVLPNFDKERVYPSDIKKMMAWYNLLVKEGLTDFNPPKSPEEDLESADSQESKEN
jgi:hypothetical protein